MAGWALLSDQVIVAASSSCSSCVKDTKQAANTYALTDAR